MEERMNLDLLWHLHGLHLILQYKQILPHKKSDLRMFLDQSFPLISQLLSNQEILRLLILVQRGQLELF